MTVIPIRDARAARAARDEGIGRVIGNNPFWKYEAMALIVALELGWEGTGEDLRIELLKSGLSRPTHHNAWGAIINAALKRQLLIKTGRVAHMQTKKSHHRATPILRRVGPNAAVMAA